MTYWLLNTVFIVPVVIVTVLASRRIRWSALALTLAVLLVMTAIFDNVMIAVGLVDYDPRFISGAFVGIAPIEDFAYALAAVLGLPALWHLLAKTPPPLPVEPVEALPVEPAETPPDLPVEPVETPPDLPVEPVETPPDLPVEPVETDRPDPERP